MAPMNPSTTKHTPTIESVQEQFETWRIGRAEKREPIPGHLWQAAVELCQEHSISYVCRRLHLSFTDLKKRIPHQKAPDAQFMEIDVEALADRWQAECRRPDGGRLLMSGSSLSAIEAVVKAFIS